MSNGHRSLSQQGLRAWRQPAAPRLRWVMPTVGCYLVLVILTCCRLFGQTDAPGSSSGSQPNPASSQPRQTAPSEGASGSSPANPSAEDSTRLVIVKFQEPEYPIEARRQQIQGQVWVHLVITETGDVESAEAISGNPLLAAATVKAMKQWKFKPYIRNGHPVRVSTKLSHDFAFQDKVKDVTEDTDATKGKVLSNPSAPADGVSSPAAPGTTVPPPAATSGNSPQRIVIAQGVSRGLLIHKVQPVYPESARLKRIEGTVVLQVVIGKDGRIKSLRPIGGPPELAEAATGAVQQWRYKPYVLDGKPVEVDTTINVNFTLTR
jgi:TonB family protein